MGSGWLARANARVVPEPTVTHRTDRSYATQLSRIRESDGRHHRVRVLLTKEWKETESKCPRQTRRRVSRAQSNHVQNITGASWGICGEAAEPLAKLGNFDHDPW